MTAQSAVTRVPKGVRPTVLAAIAAVKRVAPNSEEVAYKMEAPSSERMMWKLVRYRVAGANVLGIGTFPRHSTIFFYRGRELDDGSGLLQGTGKDTRFVTLRSPADVDRPQVTRLIKKAFALAREP